MHLLWSSQDPNLGTEGTLEMKLTRDNATPKVVVHDSCCFFVFVPFGSPSQSPLRVEVKKSVVDRGNSGDYYPNTIIT